MMVLEAQYLTLQCLLLPDYWNQEFLSLLAVLMLVLCDPPL